MVILRKILCLSFVLLVTFLQSQEIPPINIFTPQDYGAEDQNWSITQNDKNFIYVANNVGLLEYNGASWQMYKSPNDMILRTVKSVGDLIYTGGYMDFGYWQRNEFGELLYSSLVKEIGFDILEDEEIWGIIAVEDFVLFQSFERIYIYSTKDKSFRIINSDNRINKIFVVNGIVFFQKRGEGLFKLENGKESKFLDSEDINGVEIINMFSFEDDLLLITKERGFYKVKDENLEKWSINADNLILNESIYSGIRLKDGSFVLGTISNGIINIDANGNLLFSINQEIGLSNNTVLSINEDSSGNVWLGLDNGINVINLNSPYRVFQDKLGILGTVYVSRKIGNTLYLGTNQGLFYKELNTNDGFTFIKGTNGQVWSLKVIDGTLFCGHDKGTFIIVDNRSTLISDEMGTWNIKQIENNPNLIITGNYKGLHILEKTSTGWRKRNKIQGFDISSRYLEFASPTEILVSHEYKGIYRLILDEEYRNVIKSSQFSKFMGSKSGIAQYDNDILYCNQDGVFKYDKVGSTFNRDSLFSSVLSGDKYLSGKLIYNRDDKRLWGFPKNEIVYIEPGKLSSIPEIEAVPIPSEIRKGKPGYDNLLYLDNKRYLIGTTVGYLVIDLAKFKNEEKEIFLNGVTYNSNHNESVSLATNVASNLKPRENNLHFKYSVASYNALSTNKYQYRLLGRYDQWSEWSSSPEVVFENLPHGEYTFEARAITDGVTSKNKISYNFSIEKPWYIKPLALIIYALLAIVSIYLIHYLNKRYYKKQKETLLRKKAQELELEQLENQRQLIQFKNKNLQLDIENKNRELGMATMNLVKRNELLNNIKEELTRANSIDEIKSVIKVINSSLNSTGDWKLFEEAFNNVDKDFMKRIKILHPAITPNDLRLCAYLRLNLSSKEIAPLLNISHKSVEVKRYRLRKKMGLEHDQSLSNYIIEL
ncbi:helix-turn-helix and ligand-binding sensor domain-containing protein [Winogradskyella vincentii]|uniref:LuxR C-terminal-related transcriptional regulator n=1 Tax=Winogradskyella vincentii TaxID=2877122 RepID=A0ABS7Y669_9FLAO|nr:triple tyrosine motif-containing protein [Winogradskyella vincentii]MCA0154127.1 LuxR C-terminal-related transcriptional regulator [Winogradskyella vincentii]